MVKVRKVIESLYNGTCAIIEYQKVKKENKSTGFAEVVVLENQPCRVSFQSVNSTSATDNGASSLSQVIKLFIAPEVDVKPGSLIRVAQNGLTVDYRNSGEPARYSTHQEVVLELFKGWS